MLDDFVERAGVAGAVTLVTDRDGPASIEVAGLSDLESRAPMTADALFWIASMTKSITAVLALTLVDDGLLDLDSSVTQYLPNFRPRVLKVDSTGTRVDAVEPASPITLRRLLSHRAGIPYESVLERPLHDTRPIATQVQAYGLSPLLHEPGSRFDYSDAGLAVVAAIAEAATSTPYETLLQERLFDPLGMTDTSFWPDAAQLTRLASPYRTESTGLVPAPIDELQYPLDDRTARHPVPGGGLFSTAADLGAFCRMLLRGGEADGRRYLSTGALAEMTRLHVDPASEAPSPMTYGLGWLVYEDGAFGHSGMYGTAMRVSPREGIATVWMVQQWPSTAVTEAAAEFDRRVRIGP